MVFRYGFIVAVLFGAIGGLGGLILIAMIVLPLVFYFMLKRRDIKSKFC